MTDRLRESLFMKTCRREPTETTPVWFMRQAGRYMSEYQKIRSRVGFLELCKNSDLAAEVTVTAVRRLGVDAAIFFSDILLLVEPMGVSLTYRKENGPAIAKPVRSGTDVDRLPEFNPELSLPFVSEIIQKSRAWLPPNVPLLGFSGAPFTLASYLIEGGASRNFENTKKLMREEGDVFHALMRYLSRTVLRYLDGQIKAGVQAVQLFDTWVGCLDPEKYRTFVLPYTRDIFQNLPQAVPAIHFGTEQGPLLELMRQAGGQAMGLDWRLDLGKTWKRLGYDVGIQGNQDPATLLNGQKVVQTHAKRILDSAAGHPGHIFNLGHGILPQTPIENVIALVDFVHEYGRKTR
ncbi:MAG: uroporphyrinogen decarboxylase [Candidatus Omnitrophota bacterium]